MSQALEALDEVKNAHHLHAWALTSGHYVFSGHLRIAENTDSQAVLKAAHDLLQEKFSFFFATLQMESTCLDESGAEAINITPVVPDKGEA